MENLSKRWRVINPKKKKSKVTRMQAALAARKSAAQATPQPRPTVNKNQSSTSSSRKRQLEESESDKDESEKDKDSDSEEEIFFRQPTPSERKLNYFQDLLPLKPNSESDSDYILIHRSVLQDLFENFKCPACGEKKIILSYSDRQGFCHKILCTCEKCEQEIFNEYTSPRVPNESSQRPPFKVNRSITEAFLSTGLGHSSLETFCENLGMPSMSSRSFTQHLHALSEDIKKFKEEVLSEARQIVREAYELEDESLKLQEIIDIGVTFDGSWQKRGFTSLYGVGFVIDIKTGLIIDHCLLSKYCYSCILAENNYGADTDEFRLWEETHKASNMCNKNYEGSSQAMEMAAAAILWRRSEKEAKMRYTVMLSDGDAKSFSHLESIQPYGPNTTIEKEECINHVSKRLVSSLKETVSKAKVAKVTLGGVGPGQLTENVIMKLGSYYRKALEDNKDSVEAMKRAALATIYHYNSTDKKKNHSYCPSGPESWCFWQKAKALKTKTMKTHQDMSIHLNDTVFKHILPVYKRLTEKELLERCLRGGTQNTNECVHSVLWSKCPKEVFVSKRRLEIAMAVTTAEYNMGRSVSLQLKKKSKGETVSGASAGQAAARDKKRIKKSVDAQQTSNFSRKQTRKARNEQERKNLRKEGVTYAAGGF